MFSIKTTLCETKNILFSKSYRKLRKMNAKNDFKKTFKIKVRSHWTVFKISLTSAVIEFWMKKRLSNIFKTTKVKKLTEAIIKSSYRVVQESPSLISCIIFQQKYFSGYILLTNQISLSGCLYFVRYWAICVFQLFVNQAVLS